MVSEEDWLRIQTMFVHDVLIQPIYNRYIWMEHYESKEGGKDKELKQSSTTPIPVQYTTWESDKSTK